MQVEKESSVHRNDIHPMADLPEDDISDEITESDGDDMEAGASNVTQLRLQEVKLNDDTAAAMDAIRAREPDLVKRARALRVLPGTPAFNWPVVETKTVAQMTLTKPVSCDQNRAYALSVLFGEDVENGRPHIDLFRGRFVDHKGVVVDDRYSMIPIIEAMRAAGLEAQPIDGTRKAFKEWAMQVKVNDLIPKFERRVPEWDGKSRLETALIDLIDCVKTETNHKVGKYFWLSLYNRITSPGSLAPIVISLFGAQNAGKSRFSNEIVRTVLDAPEASSVQLDLGGDGKKMEFLREITGNSIIANIGEMTGFGQGDLNAIKDFVSRTSDKMRYLYEGHFDQQRQWVAVLDGNKYEGLQRDATGNRRFYPFFVGQEADKDGKPSWKAGFEINFDGFEEMFWQVMSECRAWMKENGMDTYNKLVRETSKAVFEFSAEEMKFGRGTSHNHELDTHFMTTLRECDKSMRTEWAKDENGAYVLDQNKKKLKGRTGVLVYRKDFEAEWETHCKKPLNHMHWDAYMNGLKLECESGRFKGNDPGFFFPGFANVVEFVEAVYKSDEGEYDEREAGSGSF
ncbi:VapE domain-containing protein [Caballeronia sp. LZ035]|uniref:VapE domain-containing protein n=1 Tax=Caballeronia sp. LZ035 TaxID=3038568 RepID=UPI00285D91BC|nr:VapE domain-containing protein [Caballeronia sp. LZ035]MDR5757661.1 VapE family protein [Caballeronia sp. LZ035]